MQIARHPVLRRGVLVLALGSDLVLMIAGNRAKIAFGAARRLVLPDTASMRNSCAHFESSRRRRLSRVPLTPVPRYAFGSPESRLAA